VKDRKIRAIVLSAVGILVVVCYIWVARVLQLEYTQKSTIKMAMFFAVPLLYWLAWQRQPLRSVLKRLLPRRDQLPRLLVLLAAGALIIVAANLLVEPLGRLFGIQSIFAEIQARTGTTRQKILFVSVYIPLVNALGEEFFFRSFSSVELVDLGYRRFGFIFPAALFALYHLAIFQNWFSPVLLILCLAGLFLCGLLLNRIVNRERHILGVWLLHALVNIAILSVGYRLFP
jgi:membrane protease YdiL (CAAX protease family)